MKVTLIFYFYRIYQKNQHKIHNKNIQVEKKSLVRKKLPALLKDNRTKIALILSLYYKFFPFFISSILLDNNITH